MAPTICAYLQQFDIGDGIHSIVTLDSDMGLATATGCLLRV